MIVQWAAIGTKAAMEERYLAAQHGAAYAAYCLRVRRFLPTFRRKSASGADGRA
jgi:protein-S-isoprenylcysteine O-methyltransferase Ste14